MPGINDHELAACENCKALKYLAARIDEFPQWTTTVAFYVAVHAVEALFAHHGFHSDNHESRNQRLKRENRYRHIWKHYRPLWNDSRIARYLEDRDGQVVPIFQAYLSGNGVRDEHLRHNLKQVLQSVRNLIGRTDFCDMKFNE